MEHALALVQGIYFLISGIWPILNMRTFVKVTGPKTDLWLVKTVAFLLAVVGIVLIGAQIDDQINTPVIILAIGSALSLAIVELIYVMKRVISAIYLADAVVELILIAGWLVSIALSWYSQQQFIFLR